ncbi:MAG: M6 family metalloprotease domain-containing protein [bacterium]
MLHSNSRSRRPFCSLAPLLLLLLLAAAPAHADGTACVMPPPDGVFPSHVREGRERMMAFQPEHPGGWTARTERLARQQADYRNGLIDENPLANPDPRSVAIGDFILPVLPMLFSNRATPPWNPVSFEARLFLFDTTATAQQYFDEVSYGQLNVTGDVWDWQQTGLPDTYFEGSNQGIPGRIGDLFLAALLLNDDFVDFSQYDNDGPDNIPNSGDDDGYVDVVVLVHPEIGGECMGDTTDIWSHHFWYSNHSEDGPYVTNDLGANGSHIRADRYLIIPGQQCTGGMVDIGVFCHELVHAMGIKDLYDTGPNITGDSDGIGDWGLMGSGGWNSTARPAHPTAFTKYRLGWMDLINLTADDPLLCLPPIEFNPYALRLWPHGAPSAEYFLVENRQRLGMDLSLWSPGLVIYHVNEDFYVAGRDINRVNADETRKGLDVECADAISAGHVVDADDLDIKGDMNRGDSGDVFCLTGGGTVFDANSIPDSRSYSGDVTGVAVRSVGPCAGAGNGEPNYVCASYEVGVPQPVDVCLNDCPGDFCNNIALCGEWWGSPDIWLDHDGDGDDDYPTPGVRNRVWTRLRNTGVEAAVGTTVQIYLAQGAMGLEWPDDAEQFVGVTGYPVVGPGDFQEAYLDFEYPEFPEGGGHYCIGAVVQQTYDPTTNLPANLSNNIAQVNHSILMERGSLGAQEEAGRGDGCGSVFFDTWIQLYDGFNPNGASIQAEVRVGSPPNFNDAVLPPGWNLAIDPGTGPFTLSRVERDSIYVTLWADNTTSGQSAHVPLTLWNLFTNQAIGGTTIDAHVDCVEPSVVQNVSIDWLPPSGDDPSQANVLLEWDPVDLDVLGNPEMIAYYQIVRSHDGGVPITVDRVAIDADLQRPKMQWYDTVARTCPGAWTYTIRAVDAADNFGGASTPMVLECAGAAVDAPVVAGAGPAFALEPNPVRTTAEVRFEMARPGTADIAIYDARGSRVRLLWTGHRAAGSHRLAWDGRDDSGRRLSSGVYFARAALPGGTETKKIVLVR